MRWFFATSTLAIVAASGAAVSAQAQTETAQSSDARGGELPDIIVTANKRSESLQNVPLSIAAVGGDTLREQGVASAQDLARIVPSFNVTSASYGTEVFSIRGVGFYDTTLGAVPAVSVYLDQVPIPFAVMAKNVSLDPERVEVLLGPQGTLFGQNSTGGAINYIPAKPTKDFKAGLTGTFGRFETYNIDGFVSGPLSDTLGARISFRSLNSDKGWQRSVSRNARLGRVRDIEGRILLEWQPTEKFDLQLNVNGFKDTSDTQAARYLGYILAVPAVAALVPEITGAPVVGGSSRNADWDPNTDFSRNNRAIQASVRADYHLSDSLTITNLASYNKYKHNQNQDIDGLALRSVLQQTIGTIRSYYDELRISGNIGDDLKFVAGGSYQDSRVAQSDLGFPDVYSTSRLVTFLGLPDFKFYRTNATQRFRSYAGFASADYNISDQFALHGGVRYTKTKISTFGCTVGDAGLNALIGMPTLPPGECVTLLDSGSLGLFVDSFTEDNVSFRAGVDYKPSSDVMLYANLSRGFKTGGYPVIAATFETALKPATQEQLTAYEIGFKATLADRTLRVNGAVFYYDYRDKQIRGREEVPIFGVLEKLINIPKSNVKGADFNVEWRPVTGLILSGGMSYVKSRIKDYVGIDIRGASVNLDGASFPNAPSFRSNLAFQYEVPLSDALEAFIGGDYQHVSSTRGTLGFEPVLRIASYDLVGARVGVRQPDDRWSVTAFVKNLTNENYSTGTNLAGEALISFAGLPRTYGLTLGVNF